MTKQLKTAIRDLLDEARKQGTDNMGYVHYVERVKFDDVEFYFEKECKRNWQPRYLSDTARAEFADMIAQKKAGGE